MGAEKMEQIVFFPSQKDVTCRETLCTGKAGHTHTRRGSDGVRTGDERLSVVQADENIHGAADQKEKSPNSPRSETITIIMCHFCHSDSGLVASPIKK